MKTRSSEAQIVAIIGELQAGTPATQLGLRAILKSRQRATIYPLTRPGPTVFRALFFYRQPHPRVRLLQTRSSKNCRASERTISSGSFASERTAGATLRKNGSVSSR